MSEEYRLSRRKTLQYTGAALVATTLVGSATAHGEGAEEGDPENVGDGSAYAYVEYEGDDDTELAAIGVHLTAGTLENLPETPEDWPPEDVPEGTPYTVEYELELPEGNTGPFSSVALDWNPDGHEPPDLYGDPHFDAHFYFPTTEEVDAIEGGEATYTIPDDQLPPNTYYTDALPEPLPSAPQRDIVPGMGEHLVTVPLSLPAPEQTDWSVFIWGAYDFDEDGTGALIFMEPMVTVEYLEALEDGEQRTPIVMPERFAESGRYPTEFVVRRDGDDYDIALETFEQFPGNG